MIIKAEVEFPNWENRGDGLFDEVVRQAVDGLLDAKRDSLNAAIDTEFANRVSTMFDEYLDSEVQPTDKHGKPQGPRQKVSNLLLQDIENWFDETVDSNGRSKGHRDYRSSGYGSGRDSRFSYLVQQVLKGEKYDQRFANRIKEAMKEIRANFDAQITETIKLSIKNLVK